MHKHFDVELTKDRELASLILIPEEANHLIWVIESGIKDWIVVHNKQHWEVVRYVCEQRGLLGKVIDKGNRVKLTRRDFANFLLTFCPNAVSKDETISALQTSMEHYEFAKELKCLSIVLDAHRLRVRIKEVENLLDSKETEYEEVIEPPTLEELFVDYLRRELEESDDKYPISKVCIRPEYHGVIPAVSVETYKTKNFYEEHQPSHIEVYEFVDGVLKKDKLYELVGKYSTKKNIKLYIVSTHGLLNEVRALASENNVGFIRLNKDLINTDPTYILPRYIEDQTLNDLTNIFGEKEMTTPLLVWDGNVQTSSLADIMSGRGVAVKEHRQLIVPFISDDNIEQKANDLTSKEVDMKIGGVRASDFTTYHSSLFDIDFSINPFEIAYELGLTYEESFINDFSQLGKIDVGNKHITMNCYGMENPNRYRFTMAHELGHFALHYPLFIKQNVYSVGENVQTLTIGNCETRRLEYQANKFASCLLMPGRILELLYSVYYKFYVQDIYGGSIRPLYYSSKQRETWGSYNNVVGNMAMHLKVSMMALNIRLQSIGLLNVG